MRGSPEARQRRGHARERRHAEREHGVRGPAPRRPPPSSRARRRRRARSVRRRPDRSAARTSAGTSRRSGRKCCSGSGSMRSPSPLRAHASSVPAPFGADRLVCSQSERSSMSGGISVRQVRMGSPNVLMPRMRERCAAIESPKGPAPMIAVSIRSTSLNLVASLLASAGARARLRIRRGTGADRPGERDHGCARRARGPRQRRARPRRRDGGLAARGRSLARTRTSARRRRSTARAS